MTWWHSLQPDERVGAVAWLFALAWLAAVVWPLTLFLALGWFVLRRLRRVAA